MCRLLPEKDNILSQQPHDRADLRALAIQRCAQFTDKEINQKLDFKPVDILLQSPIKVGFDLTTQPVLLLAGKVYITHLYPLNVQPRSVTKQATWRLNRKHRTPDTKKHWPPCP